MTDDRTLDRAARSWLEEGPTRAPDRAVDAALSRVQTTRQERDLRIPWRLPTMTPINRLAGVAVLVLIVAAVAIVAMRPASTVGPPGSSAVPTSPTPAPTRTTNPTAPLTAGPLAFGTYDGPTLKVSEIVASVNADPSLSAADRASVVDEILEIKDKETFSVSIELRGGQMTERETKDGETVIGSFGRYSFPDDRTLVYTESINGADVVTRFDLAIEGDSFTLHRTTPGYGPADDFVVRLIFESGPFTLR